MRPALFLSIAALAWSVVGNVVLGDASYLPRNLALTALLLVGARWAGWGWDELGLAPARHRRGVATGLAAVAVVAAALLAGVLLADRIPLVAVLLADERAAVAGEQLLYETVLRIPLGTAVFEEVLFRGVLLAAFARAWRGADARAAISTSVVFGLWHVAATAVALQINGVALTSATALLAITGAVAVTTVAGLVFAWLRRFSGSLVAPILAHIATNVGGLLAAAAT